MPRYTLCPYYKDENKKSISCEDAIRRFDALNSKWSWMDKYCDKNWQDCPYAVALTQAYEKYEEGDGRALENEKIKALQRELKGALSRQGRLEKKVDELRAVNQSFTRVNNELEKQKKQYFNKWKEEHKQLEDYEKHIGDQIEEITNLYEMRIAYLIETFVPPKMIYEDYAQEWAKDKNYSVVGDEENGRRIWKVVFRDEDEKTEKQQ
jgi:hypothetical protein